MTIKNAAEQLVRIGALQNLDLVVEQFGLDADAELARLGIDADMFRYGEMLVHIRVFGDVLEHFAHVTKCEDFPFRLASAQDLCMSGALGNLLQTTTTLGDALQEIATFQHLHHAQPVVWRLDQTDNTATFNICLQTQELSPAQRSLTVQLGLAQVFLIVRELTADRVRPIGVMLQSSSRDQLTFYQDFFQAPVEYATKVDGLVFAAGDLDFVLSHPDINLHDTLSQNISSIATEPEESPLAQEVRAIIRSLLPTGNFSLDRVAQCYACDRRTLQRYLREQANTTYQVLLDDVRFDLVKRYLKDTRIPMSQLTFLAGFTSPSNFARAFHKRFGMSPKQWREQQGAKGPARRRRLSFRKGLS